MADSEGFDEDQLGGGGGGGVGCFLPLLFSDEVVGLDLDETLNYTSSFSTAQETPKMLCFGTYRDDGIVSETVRTVQMPGEVTCSDSSSTCNNKPNSSSKPNRKRIGSCQEPINRPVNGTGGPAESRGSCKKSKAENPPTTTGHAKVRKEKLGERIVALQQLVSPFGKTDTASVLHEAMGYIKFLHDQVQVLCSPYLQRLPPPSSHHQHHHHLPEGGEDGEMESRKDLRSRGLCLVPSACTVHVANTNGADFWSPAMANHSSNKH